MTTIQTLDLAVVQDIEINNASPDAIMITASGQLPNTCSKIEKKDIEFEDNIIVVSIYTSQPQDADCELEPVAFNEKIQIDLSSGQYFSYTILVNGISISAEVEPSTSAAAVLQPTPSPSPEPELSTEESSSESNQGISDTRENGEATQTATATEISPTAEAADDSQPEPANTVEPTPTAEASQSAAAPTEPNTAASGCLDKAAFYADVTIPDNTIFKPGDTFKKTWRVRNEGNCTWDEGYSLVFASGEIMNGALSNTMPVITPGEITEISIDLKAPTRWGQYTGNWHFENDKGQRFGVGAGGHDYIWVQIFVDSPAPAPTSNPPSESPGQSGGARQSSASCAVGSNPSYEGQVLSLINAARTAQGLNPLSLQPQLSSAAFVHSSDMACNDFIGHTGSDASSWYDRVSTQGYANFNSARENIYVGNPNFGGTPDGAFDWWMNSQVHRDNILNPNVSEIGIGYAYYENSSYGGYYTVVFARP